MNAITFGIFAGFDWFIRIVKLNILWLLSCIAGLFIIGLFPAMASAIAVANEWVKGNTEVSIWKTYMEAFKKYFWKSQIIGYIFLIAYLVLIVDIRLFLSLNNHLIWIVLIIVFSILIMLLLSVTLYIFPLMIEKEYNMKDLIRTAFFTSGSYIQMTFLNLVGVLAMVAITFRYPAVLLFLTGGGIALWLTCMSQIVKSKIEVKYTKLHGTSKREQKMNV